ncbi:hypothetical protein [Streptomyces sp. NPDC017949]|uniref:hypothetical protein n=1 Tax=Streptomyces sp. NPDC017949 TaxID=3365020 RepID=UPI00379F531A
MLGWNITVSTLSPAEMADATPPTEAAATLAFWSVRPFGTDWLRDLELAGKAKELLNGGYPCRYVVRAGDLLPLLADGPPIGRCDVVLSASMSPDRMAACTEDQMLTVDAWDQS